MPDLVAALPFALGVVALVATAAYILFKYMEPCHVEANYDKCIENWQEARLATCKGKTCEEVLCRVPQQPINTFSNLWYVFWGTLLAGAWGTAPASVLGIAMAYLCVGSMFYHAVSTNWAHLMDETGMYATYSVLFVYALCVQFGVRDDWTAIAMLAGATITVGFFGSLFDRLLGAGFVQLTKFEYRNVVIALTLGPAALLPLFDYAVTWPWVVAVVALFAVAFLFQRLDASGKLPTPRGIAWGHGVWHLLTALATALTFMASAVRAAP